MGKPRKVGTTIDRMQEILGSLDEEEMNELADSIDEGWLPGSVVLIDESTDKIIDGHQRAAAYKQATGKELPKSKMKKVAIETPDEAAKMIVAANLRRRHLTREQRGELNHFLAEEMGWSVRMIAAETGVAKSTVQDDIEGVRNRTGENPTLDDEPSTTRVGRDGKTYPAKVKKIEPTTKTLTQYGRLESELDEAIDVIDERMAEFTALLRDGQIPMTDEVATGWVRRLNLAIELLDEVAPK